MSLAIVHSRAQNGIDAPTVVVAVIVALTRSGDIVQGYPVRCSIAETCISMFLRFQEMN